HFLEHMLFKGSERRSAEDVNREFDEMGANYNAFTSEENTVYYGHVLPEFQPRLIDLLTDMMRPALRSDDFDMEKNVILEEIALYQDRPTYIAYEKARRIFFGEHPLGNTVLGTTESISALHRDQMAEYHARRYAPNNLTLVLTGAYDWEQAVAQARALSRSWTPAEVSRDTRPSHPASGVHVETTDKFNRVQLLLLAPGVAAQSPERSVAEIVAAALGGSEGSRLYWA
ncbi:MAG: peptidase M16, partial [Chloroflexota bacterium]